MAAEEKVLLEIISRLPDRYSPAQLVGAVGLNRVEVTGWIIDQAIGRETDFDEGTAKILIADLCARKLLRVNEFQKLEVTAKISGV